MDTEYALEVFKQSVAEVTTREVTQQAMLPTVSVRPVGAQAVTVKRDLPHVLQNIKVLADMAGDDWYYSWQVKDKNSPTGKTTIEGPSVKLANDLARLYGNCTGEVWKVDDIGTHWVFHARFIDFETGYEYSRPFRQRKTSNAGGSMQADRLEDIVFQIGASKAFRNCIVNALGSFAEYALSHAKNALFNKVSQNLDKHRAATLRRLHDQGVEVKRIEYKLATVAAEWDARQVCQVIAEMRAVNEGMASFDELYPDPAGGSNPQPDGNGGQALQNFVDKAKTPDATQNAPAATGEALEGKPSNDTAKGPADTHTSGDAGAPRKARSGKAGAEKPGVPPAAGQAVDAGELAQEQQPKAQGTKPQDERGAPPAPVKHGQHPDPRELTPGPNESDRVWPGPKACPECGAGVGGFHKKGCMVGVPADPAETCAHCGGEDGTHIEGCVLTAKRPVPTDANGQPLKAGRNGEVIEDGLEIPTFLKRPKPEDKPKIDAAALLKEVRTKHPMMARQWHDGYVARAGGAAKTDVPQELAPIAVRHWAAGWDARDMEEESNAEES